MSQSVHLLRGWKVLQLMVFLFSWIFKASKKVQKRQKRPWKDKQILRQISSLFAKCPNNLTILLKIPCYIGAFYLKLFPWNWKVWTSNVYYVSVDVVRNNEKNVLHDTELEQSIHGNLDLGLTRARDIFGPELTFVLLLLLLLLHHLLLLLHLLLRSTHVRAFHIPVFGLSPLV